VQTCGCCNISNYNPDGIEQKNVSVILLCCLIGIIENSIHAPARTKALVCLKKLEEYKFRSKNEIFMVSK
jgi:hypothetical protein